MTSDHTPYLGKSSFQCPYCGAISHQYWLRIFAKRFAKEEKPFIPSGIFVTNVSIDHDIDTETKRKLLQWYGNMRSKKIFINSNNESYSELVVENCWFSKCYGCDGMSIWVHDTLVYPDYVIETRPNDDLSSDIKADFLEAARVADVSPRGAAALLRLCIQKLCIQLGKPGKKINDDIAALVKEGLDPRIQKALDVVRVVGNNAVHPGHLDLQDNKQIVSKLSALTNIIAEKMLTQPKHIDSLYADLPDGARKQIESRDMDKGKQK